MVALPVGTYTHCAEGAYASGAALDTLGFLIGASLKLAQRGTSVTAKYVDSNGTSSSIGFAIKTSASAALTLPARFDTTTVSGDCVLGGGFYPMEMNASAGALMYDAGTVFVSLEGRSKATPGRAAGKASPRAFG